MHADAAVIHAETENPVLRACSQETRSSLMDRGDLRSFESEALLFRRGEPAGKVIFLLEGSLQMERTGARGRRQVICTMTPQTCGGICLQLLNDQGLADVRALSPGQVLLVDSAGFRTCSRGDQQLFDAGWDGVAACMAHLSSLVEHLSFDKVGQRVAVTLFERTAQDGDFIYLTQAELAAVVGTTREVVARSLAGLQSDGMIRLGRGRIKVLRRDELTHMM